MSAVPFKLGLEWNKFRRQAPARLTAAIVYQSGRHQCILDTLHLNFAGAFLRLREVVGGLHP